MAFVAHPAESVVQRNERIEVVSLGGGRFPRGGLLVKDVCPKKVWQAR